MDRVLAGGVHGQGGPSLGEEHRHVVDAESEYTPVPVAVPTAHQIQKILPSPQRAPLGMSTLRLIPDLALLHLAVTVQQLVLPLDGQIQGRNVEFWAWGCVRLVLLPEHLLNLLYRHLVGEKCTVLLVPTPGLDRRRPPVPVALGPHRPHQVHPRALRHVLENELDHTLRYPELEVHPARWDGPGGEQVQPALPGPVSGGGPGSPCYGV
mmetsp:Transcript_10810/g.23884  ORF Transcript_10810/g.23884 Transcript_10810/m.23884 type:complete len:209 (-) Transcript_10810:323-949(-)